MMAVSGQPNGEGAGPDGGEDTANLRHHLRDVEERLREAEETIAAIRSGDVDAIVVQGQAGPQVYTLENDDRPYRRLIEQIGEGALTLTPDGVVLYCNSRMAALLRMPHEKVIGGRMQEMIAADDENLFEGLTTQGGGRGRLRLRVADGGTIPVHLSLTDLVTDGTRLLCGIVTDLTEQQQAETALRDANARLRIEIIERERAEALLHQAQKMEALGQLTGGVAHDFNNLLTVVIGGLEMIERQLPKLQPGPTTARLDRGIDLAKKGADRAAVLVQRMLAFSRRQALDPRPVDVNRLVGGMLEVLRRTLGETIALDAVLAECLWQAQADPNQLESAVLNLAVNARDAMPNGGRLTVRTENRMLAHDGSDPDTADAVAGDYVMVAVTDTGIGMDQETLDRACEPFFTTKQVGYGTGLGLSQVYGFVKQSTGHIALRSRPGAGTTVEIYLPRLVPVLTPGQEQPETFRAEAGGNAGSRGNDTVLVVEDNEDVRSYSVEALRELGYEVLAAVDGGSALDLLDHHPEIRLLFTDIGLPGGMNGRQLANLALRRKAGLKVLLTTGYVQSAATAAQPLDAAVQIVTKPFTFGDLAGRIRLILDGPPLHPQG